MTGMAGGRGWLAATELRLPFGKHSCGTQISSGYFTFREVYPLASSPDFFVVNFLILSLPGPWPLTKLLITIHASIYNFNLIFFPPRKMNNEVHCPKLCLWKSFPLPWSFRGVPEKGCVATAIQWWVVSAYPAEPSANRPGFLFFSQLILGHSLRCFKRESRQTGRSGDHGYLGHFLELTCAFRACPGLITYINILFDSKVLLCPPNSMVWSVG